MKFTIKGEPRTKKNSMEIHVMHNRPFLSQNQRYKDYEADCLWQIGRAYRQHINEPVNIKYKFYRSTKRKVDLPNLESAMDDILVKAGVIEDDNRDIVAGHNESMVLYSKENPRVEVEIEPISNYIIGYEKWNKK